MMFLIQCLLCIVFVVSASTSQASSPRIQVHEYRNIFSNLRENRYMDDTCHNTPDDTPGTCVVLDSCQSIRNQLKSSLTPAKVQMLLRVHCGFQRKKPMVCCPDKNVSNNGTAGNNETGDNGQISNWNLNGNKNKNSSNIGNANNNNIIDNSTSNNVVNTMMEHKSISLLPLDTCGGTAEDRIFLPPNVLSLFDIRPTLARLSYTQGSQSTYRCGGSLISSQYVLTAAHCVTDLPQGLKLTSVVLGEFQVTSDPDCDEINTEEKYCLHPIQRVNVSNVIIHPQYKSNLHDIALVRLSSPVQLGNGDTDLIALCLPVNNVTLLSHLSMKWMKTSGWGTLLNGTSALDKRMYGIMTPVNNSQCDQLLKDDVKVTESHVCAVGSGERDTSIGDTGGPLMVFGAWGNDNGPRLIQIGVESFTPSQVSRNGTGLPSVYTSIPEHLTWILDNMMP